MKQETAEAKRARAKHERKGVKTDFNQTIVKGQLYCFQSGATYCYGKWGGYAKAYVVRAKVDHFWTIPAHWSTEVFEEVESIGKLYAGST